MSTQLRPTDVKRLNRQWRRNTHNRISLIIESVTQPFNLGSILRTSATLGIHTIWLTGNAITPDHPQVGKTALGTDTKIHWEKLATTGEAVTAARTDGYHIVAIELARDAQPLHTTPLTGDICLAVGAEDHGCSPALLAAADATAYIPQTGRVGSLNVAVATAIAIAETRRREWADLATPDPAAPTTQP